MGVAFPTDENTGTLSRQDAHIERARRFLLAALPPPLVRNGEHIQLWDNYLEGTQLRLRKMRVPQTNQYFLELTQKTPLTAGLFDRHSVTVMPLSARGYNRLWPVFEKGGELRKNRYAFTYEGREYAVDVFLGAWWGLILAKTFFDTDEALANHLPPSFALREVTQDERFSGGHLPAYTLAQLLET